MKVLTSYKLEWLTQKGSGEGMGNGDQTGGGREEKDWMMQKPRRQSAMEIILF